MVFAVAKAGWRAWRPTVGSARAVWCAPLVAAALALGGEAGGSAGAAGAGREVEAAAKRLDALRARLEKLSGQVAVLPKALGDIQAQIAKVPRWAAGAGAAEQAAKLSGQVEGMAKDIALLRGCTGEIAGQLEELREAPVPPSVSAAGSQPAPAATVAVLLACAAAGMLGLAALVMILPMWRRLKASASRQEGQARRLEGVERVSREHAERVAKDMAALRTFLADMRGELRDLELFLGVAKTATERKLAVGKEGHLPWFTEALARLDDMLSRALTEARRGAADGGEPSVPPQGVPTEGAEAGAPGAPSQKDGERAG